MRGEINKGWRLYFNNLPLQLLKMMTLEELKSELTERKRIAILSHRNPDGDAIGSTLALRWFLEDRGHQVRVIVPSEFPTFLNYLPGRGDILIYDKSKSATRECLLEAQYIFCLDFNDLARIDPMGPIIEKSTAKKIMIDHHLEPENFADLTISETSASSTCEMLYDFFNTYAPSEKLSEKIAQCLYTGLVTDTGGFRHALSPKVFETASALLSSGVDAAFIQNELFNSQPLKRLRLMGHVLTNRMEILEDCKTAIIHLNKSDYNKFDIQRGDTEGLVNELLTAKHISVAVLARELHPNVKLSFRSKGNINVREIASKYFNGGGHANAAGGSSPVSLTDTLTKLKGVFPDYKEAILAG